MSKKGKKKMTQPEEFFGPVFSQLTSAVDGSAVYVLPDSVESIAIARTASVAGSTVVTTHGGASYCVKEAPAAVMTAIGARVWQN